MDLLKALKKLSAKITHDQEGIPTILDNYFLENIKDIKSGNHKDPNFISLFTEFEKENSRYIKFEKRLADSKKSVLTSEQRLFSQGFKYAPTWKNHALIKNPFDKFIIEMVINELKPRTIIELGSTQGSYNWLRSICNSFAINSKIVSIDLYHKIKVLKNDLFLYKDLNTNDWIFDFQFFDEFQHPYLIIEDCHVNLKGILEYFYKIMQKDDYLIIEDSSLKCNELKNCLHSKHDIYVDTKYTDFFGYNATSAINSIFRKV